MDLIPIPLRWTNFTATVHGRVLKLVPCENCSTEYVYVLEREGTGAGHTFYGLNEAWAQDAAVSSADAILQEYLANDFDPVPCPACGHYQTYMFPKLYETTSLWGPVARVGSVALACLAAVAAAYWGVAYLQRADGDDLRRAATAGALVAAFALVGYGLAAAEEARFRRFDPNAEDQQARIERGRGRAVTRAEFEAARQPPADAEGGS